MLQKIETKKVLIGVPCGSGFIPSAMVQSLMELYKPCPCQLMILDRVRIDEARNTFVREAIAGGFDYLLMVDDDNPVPHDALLTMMHDDLDVVIAPILTRNPDENGVHKLCAFYAEEHRSGIRKITIFNNVEKFRDAGPVHDIDAGGTGCILVKRQVFEHLSNRYDGRPFQFIEENLALPITVRGKLHSRIRYGEDVAFTMRARLHSFGVHLDTRVVPHHLGAMQRVVFDQNNF